MREFQAQKKEKVLLSKILKSKIFFLILAILLFFLIRGNFKMFNNYLNIKNDYKKDLDNYNTLQKREEKIIKDLENIKTESGLDYEIRKKLDVSKEGEKIIKIIDNR